MNIIEKEFPITEFERKEMENNEKIAQVANIPTFLIKSYIVRHMESYRQTILNNEQVQPECIHHISNERFEVMGKSRPIGVSVYSADHTGQSKRTLFYFIHGGAFAGGSSEMNDNLMRLVADRTDALVASVDYSLSPEAKYPEGLLDCQEGLQFLLRDGRFAIDPDKIILAGDSAGGNLAAALTLKFKDEKIMNVHKQILLYPALDLAYVDGESYRQKEIAYRSMRKLILVARELYLSSKAERYHPYVSPLCATITEAMPDTLLLVAEVDGLRSEGIRYGELLTGSGTKVRCIMYKGASHAFINNLGKSYVADDAAEEIIRFVSEL
ncbi:MAG: alpha/beta hydrolase [Eubacteriales bacterium]